MRSSGRRATVTIVAVVSATMLLSGCSLVQRFQEGVRQGIEEQKARSTPGAAPSQSEYVDPAYPVGECDLDGDGPDYPKPIACTEPHDLQIFATPLLADILYPGDDAVDSLADSACYLHFPGFVGSASDDSAYDYTYWSPAEDDWDGGDRSVICFLESKSGEQMTKSAKNSERDRVPAPKSSTEPNA